jgi:hypothetical protein
VSIRIAGPLLNGGLKQPHSLLRLIRLEGQISQVEKSGEIVGVDLQGCAQLGLRGLSVALGFQGKPKPAVHRCIRRTLCQHGPKLLFGGSGLSMLQIRAGQVETRIARFGMGGNVVHEDLLRLLPISGVLKYSAKLIQDALVPRM